jgi:hypothetical protein
MEFSWLIRAGNAIVDRSLGTRVDVGPRPSRDEIGNYYDYEWSGKVVSTSIPLISEPNCSTGGLCVCQEEHFENFRRKLGGLLLTLDIFSQSLD